MQPNLNAISKSRPANRASEEANGKLYRCIVADFVLHPDHKIDVLGDAICLCLGVASVYDLEIVLNDAALQELRDIRICIEISRQPAKSLMSSSSEVVANAPVF